LPGNPPYQYKWEVSCTPTFSSFWYQSYQQSCTVNSPPCGAETPFWIRLRVTSADGAELVASRRVSVKNCEEFQGSEERNVLIKPHLGIYPNPANDIVILSFNGEESEFHSVSICDLSGRQVWQSPTKNGQDDFRIFVGDMENGIYFLNIYGNLKIETHKLIIQKQ
jgi:hypothetical protein